VKLSRLDRAKEQLRRLQGYMHPVISLKTLLCICSPLLPVLCEAQQARQGQVALESHKLVHVVEGIYAADEKCLYF
jgi:hypothetical protein